MLSKRFKFVIAGCLFLLTGSLLAQKENLARDFSFFEIKSKEFAIWLDKTGLGKSLEFDAVRMRPLRNRRGIDSTELELLLLLRTHNPDSAIGIWEGLKRGFDTPEDSLENYLYRTFIHKMEIPGEQGSIRIYIKDTTGTYNSCFYIFIWQESDTIYGQKILSEYRFRGCRTKSFEITVQPPQVKKAGTGKASKVVRPKIKTANEVFEIIRKYVIDSLLNQHRYHTPDCNDRNPGFNSDSVRNSNSYRFTVKDLCREVLTDQHRSLWEQFWGYNTIAMERLAFQFEYYPIQGGFILKCIIEGKYGSGVFKPRASGYMNMEPDFDDFFDSYKNRLRREIQKRL